MKQYLCVTLLMVFLLSGSAAALEVVSLAPSYGAPGTLVVISGGPFSAATQPFLGNHYVPPLHVVENYLEFAVPVLPAGNYTLSVQDDQSAARQTFQFEVLAPAPDISALYPEQLDVCRVEPELLLEITGQNFLPGAVVLINEIALPASVLSPTRLEVRLQGFRQPGVYGVTVRNPDGVTSLPRSLLVDSVPEISAIEQGAEYLMYYEVMIHGKNFLPNSILVVKEPEDSVIGQAYRQFSFTARNPGAAGAMSVAVPQRDRVVLDDCQTLIYYRYPSITQKKSLGFMVLNPDGSKTDMYYADLP